MSKLQWISNGVLLALVAVLFVLHFTSARPSASTSDVSMDTLLAIGKSGGIAFVNIDSLQNGLDMFASLRGKLEVKAKSVENELGAKSQAYEKAVRDYQYKAERGLITRSEAQATEQQLMQEQQRLLALREQLGGELAEEEQVMNRTLINEIHEYLKEYSKGKNYSYILSTAFGSNVLYANDSLNITADVLKGLNQRFKEAQAKK